MTKTTQQQSTRNHLSSTPHSKTNRKITTSLVLSTILSSRNSNSLEINHQNRNRRPHSKYPFHPNLNNTNLNTSRRKLAITISSTNRSPYNTILSSTSRRHRRLANRVNVRNALGLAKLNNTRSNRIQAPSLLRRMKLRRRAIIPSPNDSRHRLRHHNPGVRLTSNTRYYLKLVKILERSENQYPRQSLRNNIRARNLNLNARNIVTRFITRMNRHNIT